MSDNYEFPLKDMFKDTDNFKENFAFFMMVKYAKKVEDSNAIEKYTVLSSMIMAYCTDRWQQTKGYIRNTKAKNLYYFSLEFLVGRLLTNNLLSIGVYDVVKKGLEELDTDINEIEEIEADAGLGNGGLGRLAACFLDSLSTLNYAGNGNCIRYQNGLFKQLIIDNKQMEVPDQWLSLGYPWEIRKPDNAVEVKFFGHIDIWRDDKGDLHFEHRDAESVLAVPYDVPILGANTKTTTTLRLWSAEPTESIPKDRDYVTYLNDVNKICLNLYPEDYSEEGKLVRIKQEYFFVAAGLQTIVKEHLRVYGTLDNLSEKVVIQLNDTHPALAIPELMRILMDEHGYKWADAYAIVTKVFAYTNHTVLSEALEKWPVDYIKRLLPRIYLIIEEINNQFVNYLKSLGKSSEFINMVKIISEGNVRMAYLSIVGSFSVNGVAKLHTDILINGIFKRFYEIYPEKFNNKTNGITHRRWFLYSNPELAKLVTKTTNLDLNNQFNQIEELEKYVNDENLQKEFLEVKRIKKQQLADYLNSKYDIHIDPNSIFDVQAKRLHAYKRQLLNVLYIISLYLKIKNNPDFNMPKTTFIFGAKAASNYYFAKKVIELINCVSKVIDNDPVVSKYIKVVFIPNYRVSVAEKLMPAADVSEQISTAGKEASGTGNMKFMMNGAVTLGTLDGANVEISELVGDDNIVIFGLNANEVKELKPNYDPYTYYQNDSEIKAIIDTLTDGTWSADKECFRDIANEFLLRKDEYLILADFKSYKDAHSKIFDLYNDSKTWAKMCLTNVSKSAYFSSDRTIQNYVDDIWHLNKLV